MQTSDIIATIGVSILLAAFLLQSIKAIKAESNIYCFLNLIGAAVAGYASYMISFYPFGVLESVWCFVAVYSLISINKKKIVSRETNEI